MEKISEKKVGRRRIDFDRNESKVNSVDMQTMEDKVRKTQGDGKVEGISTGGESLKGRRVAYRRLLGCRLIFHRIWQLSVNLSRDCKSRY